jgi:protein-S-isoprenylcysteine O-methyltransferase Ste14
MSVREDSKFSKLGTPIKPFDEPNKLVTDGFFKYSRNPMYLGFALVLLGVWLLLGALSPLLGVVLFVAITDRWYIPFEERALVEKFGPEFQAYRSKTRRWI